MDELLDRTDRMPPRFDDTLPVHLPPFASRAPIAVPPLQRAARGTRPMRALPPPIPPLALRRPTRPPIAAAVAPVPPLPPQTPPAVPRPLAPRTNESRDPAPAARARPWLAASIAACLAATMAMLTIGLSVARSRAEAARPAGVERTIVTTPPGAAVTLIEDGRATVLGQTPLAASFPPSGSYDLVLSARGYATAIHHVARDTTGPLAIELAVAAPAR